MTEEKKLAEETGEDSSVKETAKLKGKVTKGMSDDDLVTITVQRRYEGDKRRFVSSNGRTCSVITGKPVKVPRWAARCIRQSEAQRENWRGLMERLVKGSSAPKN